MALIRATYFLFTVRGVFEASPEGGLEGGILFNAGCGSESEDESKREKNRAELHVLLENIFGDWDDKKALKRFRVSFESRGCLLPVAGKFFFHSFNYSWRAFKKIKECKVLPAEMQYSSTLPRGCTSRR